MKISETHRHEIKTSDNKVAGCVYIRKYFNGKPTYIANLKVYKKFRFQGYGNKLMENTIKRYGKETLKLRYFSHDKEKMSDKKLRKFYEKFGFKGPKTLKTLVRAGIK